MFEKIEKLTSYFKYRMPKTIFVWILLGVLITVYASFFVITAVSPQLDINSLFLTPLDTDVDMGLSKTLQIKAWDYDEEKGTMGVILNFSGASDYEEITYDYKVMARDKSNNKIDGLEIKNIYDSETYKVLVVSNVSGDFKEIAIGIDISGKGIQVSETASSTTPTEDLPEPETIENTVNLYTNFEKVNRVDSVDYKTIEDVMIRIVNKDIETYVGEIESIKSQIKANNTKIENIDKSVKALYDDILYATSERVVEIRGEIKDLMASKKSVEESNTGLEKEKIILETRVKDANEKIQEIKDGKLKVAQSELDKQP